MTSDACLLRLQAGVGAQYDLRGQLVLWSDQRDLFSFEPLKRRTAQVQEQKEQGQEEEKEIEEEDWWSLDSSHE